MKSNIALIIAYDGSSFFGWQKTATGPSIEQTLEKALQRILQEPIVLQAASRTDRGVHAEGQCINFLIEKNLSIPRLIKSLNALLPPEIRILKGAQMPLDFHPTLHVQHKEYEYQLSVGAIQLPHERFFSWHIPYSLNVTQMREAASHFTGIRDYSSFCNQRKNLNYTHKERSIENIEILENKHRLIIRIRGNHFLYKMVRNIVGTLVYVGRRKIVLEAVTDLFLSPSRGRAGITAPAHGLILKHIFYPEHFNLGMT